MGNRLKKGGTGNKQALSYGPGNKLLAINQKALKYNKAGSAEVIPSDMGIKRYEYNAEQRPVKFYLNDKLTAEYAYNGLGERVKKTVYNGDKKQTTYYLYSSQRISAEVNENGEVTDQYIYNLGRPLIKLEGKSVYSIVSDHLGTPRLMVDDEGDTVWAASYDPFGQADIVREDKILNLRFPGQYFDGESGGHYNYFRDYDPSLGRYFQFDPIGLNGGLNAYSYVGGTPLTYVDRLGLCGVNAQDSDVHELAREGGVARLIDGAIDFDEALDLANILRRATDSEIKALFPHLQPYSDFELDIRRYELFTEVRRVGLGALIKALSGAGEVSSDAIVGLTVDAAAGLLGVPKKVIVLLDIAFAAGSIPNSHEPRREVIDRIREKYE